MKPDFSGYATKNDLLCTDGRVIKNDAFKHQDGQRVPLIWQHFYDSPENVLGHAILENRDDGVYAYGYFNDTSAAKAAKEIVRHGDVDSLSIYANRLVQNGENVVHGMIKELSLVVAGANPGATIDQITMTHGDNVNTIDDEALIRTNIILEHGVTDEGEIMSGQKKDLKHATAVAEPEIDETEFDPEAIFNSLDTDQKELFRIALAQAAGMADEDEDEDDEPEEEPENNEDSEAAEAEENDDAIQHSDNPNGKGDTMSRNVFDQTKDHSKVGPTLTHSDVQKIMSDAQVRFGGSLKHSFLAHAQEYGIADINLLFPDARNLTTTPEFYKRRTEWVADVLGSVKSQPHARVKTVVADITAAEARARGYITGTEKTDEVIQLLKRSTTPTTVYKKQRIDRDDLLDITDFDVIQWIKAEMRLMIDEEIARAILIGDGRGLNSDDKIKDPAGAVDGAGIRSIANDADFYAHKVELDSNVTTESVLEAMLRARSVYRGSGTPTLYTTDSFIADALLLKDQIKRRIYNSLDDVAAAIRVSKLVPVEVMETAPEILGIMVNLIDYTVGTDKGGELNFFDDFDIDWNQYKYLIESRMSGGLTRPKSAIVFKRQQGTPATPVSPSFDGDTNTITIPTVEGIDYLIDDEVVTGTVVIEEDTTVTAMAKEDYYIPGNTTTSFSFTYVDEQ